MHSKENLSKNKVIVIEGSSYTVTFPNVGELRRIEALKQMYSTNQYGAMARSGMISSSRALDIIDMISHFTVLIPKFEDGLLKVNSIDDLNPMEAMPFVKAYKKQFKPWYDSWMSVIYADDEEDIIPEEEDNTSEG